MGWKAHKSKIQCLKCWQVIESQHRHDFVRCGCGKVAVDGGSDYFKAVGDRADYLILADPMLGVVDEPIEYGLVGESTISGRPWKSHFVCGCEREDNTGDMTFCDEHRAIYGAI